LVELMTDPQTPTPNPAPNPAPDPTPEPPKKPNTGFMILIAILCLAFGLPTTYSGGVMVGGAFGVGDFPSIGFIAQLGLGLVLTGFGLASVLAVVKVFTGRPNG
jgi:hypothetical protein